MSATALTTIFTAPTSCFNNQYTNDGGGSVYVKDISITSSECYPSGFRPLFAESVPYSPGVCPLGYTNGNLSPYGQYATAAVCCPNGMTAYSSGLGCSLVVSKTTLVDDPTGPLTLSKGILAVHAVYVAWASTDLSRFTPASAPVLSALTTGEQSTTPSLTSILSTTSTSAASSTSTSAPTSPPATLSVSTLTAASAVGGSVTPKLGTPTSTPSPHPALSIDAQAGIGAGVGTFGLVAIAALVWTTMKRRRHRYQLQGQIRELQVDAAPQGEKMEYYGSPTSSDKRHISELSSDGALSELRGSFSPFVAETDNAESRAELAGR